MRPLLRMGFVGGGKKVRGVIFLGRFMDLVIMIDYNRLCG